MQMLCTASIPHFDYTRPPPGHALPARIKPSRIPTLLRTQWRNYKKLHDPPAMWTGFNRYHMDLRKAWTRFGIGHDALGYIELSTYTSVPYSQWQDRARIIAWAHYDRRAAIARVLRYKGITKLELWPAALTFWDSQCDSCEAWEGQSAPLESFPDILHMLGERQGQIEPQTDLAFPVAPEEVRNIWLPDMECRVHGQGDQIFTLSSTRTARSVTLYGEDGTLRAPYGKLEQIGARTPVAGCRGTEDSP